FQSGRNRRHIWFGPKGKRFFVKRISIEHAQPGQVLAQKLQRSDGVLLAGQGTEVTEGLLRMLARMNIDSIVIEEDEQLSPEELEEIFRARQAELETRFARVTDQPVLVAFKKALTDQAREARDEALAAIIPAAGEDAPEGGGQ
ncbi:MAG: hypothetical protein LBS31_06920, partial [Candidatus Adiutrix sp.]|nr:hypothetical protein [Candidatus Adiutrix sp.]